MKKKNTQPQQQQQKEAQPAKQAKAVSTKPVAVKEEKPQQTPKQQPVVAAATPQKKTSVTEVTQKEITIVEEVIPYVSLLTCLKSSAASAESLLSVQALSTSLVQALTANDVNQIAACLEQDKAEIIDGVVKGLAEAKVLALIEHLNAKSSETRGSSLGKWVKAVLNQHSTLLITAPANIQEKLSPLVKELEAKAGHLERFVGLRGKIDMVLAARKLENRSIFEDSNNNEQSRNLNNNEETKQTQPLVVYEAPESKKKGKKVPVTKKAQLKKDVEIEEDLSDSVSSSEEDSFEQQLNEQVAQSRKNKNVKNNKKESKSNKQNEVDEEEEEEEEEEDELEGLGEDDDDEEDDFESVDEDDEGEEEEDGSMMDEEEDDEEEVEDSDDIDLE